MLLQKEIIITSKEEISGFRKNITRTYYYINNIEICYTEKGGSDMFCTIKNGSPSNIRTQSKKVYSTQWNITGLRNFLIISNNHQDLFANNHCDTTWGYTGKAYSKKEISDRFYIAYKDLYSNNIILSNLLENDNLNILTKRIKASKYINDVGSVLHISAIYNANSLINKKNLEENISIDYKQNKKYLFVDCIKYFPNIKKFLDYPKGIEQLLEEAFIIPEKYDQILNKLMQQKFEMEKLSEIKKVNQNKNVLFIDIKQFVKNNSYLIFDSEENNTLQYSTRENGDVGNEKHSEIDMKEARKIANLIEQKFGKEKIICIVENSDEWVYLFIELK